MSERLTDEQVAEFERVIPTLGLGVSIDKESVLRLLAVVRELRAAVARAATEFELCSGRGSYYQKRGDSYKRRALVLSRIATGRAKAYRIVHKVYENEHDKAAGAYKELRAAEARLAEEQRKSGELRALLKRCKLNFRHTRVPADLEDAVDAVLAPAAGGGAGEKGA